MSELTMGVSEAKFADFIWENAPVTAVDLAKIAAERLGWKKTTSYTVLKRLCDKGIFFNERGLVSVILTKDRFYSLQSQKYVRDTFGDSLPTFLAAFTAGRPLTEEEKTALRALIESSEK